MVSSRRYVEATTSLEKHICKLEENLSEVREQLAQFKARYEARVASEILLDEALIEGCTVAASQAIAEWMNRREGCKPPLLAYMAGAVKKRLEQERRV